MTKRLKIEAINLDQNDLERSVRNAYDIYKNIEGMYYYLDGEAEMDIALLDDFRITLGDMSDQIHELKWIIERIITPYRERLHQQYMEEMKQENGFDLEAFMEKERTDPDMDGRC